MSPQIASLNKCHIDCTLIAFVGFFHGSVFSNVPLNCLPQTMHNHTGCIWSFFLQRAFSYASSNDPYWPMHSHIGCICVSSDCRLEKIHGQISRIYLHYLFFGIPFDCSKFQNKKYSRPWYTFDWRVTSFLNVLFSTEESNFYFPLTNLSSQVKVTYWALKLGDIRTYFWEAL